MGNTARNEFCKFVYQKKSMFNIGICKACGRVGSKKIVDKTRRELSVHHVLPYAIFRNNTEAVVLCRQCHDIVDRDAKIREELAYIEKIKEYVKLYIHSQELGKKYEKIIKEFFDKVGLKFYDLNLIYVAGVEPSKLSTKFFSNEEKEKLKEKFEKRYNKSIEKIKRKQRYF